MTKPRQNSSIWPCATRRRNGKCRRVNGARRKPSSPSCSKTGSSWHDGQPAPHTRFLIVPASSFLKRRMGLPIHAQASGLDQILEAGLPLLLLRRPLDLSWLEIAALVGAFVVLEVVLSPVL